jgi:ligand-binding sensor domain-containing protein
LLWATLAVAQYPYVRPINYPYQIGSKTIYDVFADSKGQIWLGTEKGLFRFNGKYARPIVYAQTKQNDITHLTEDKEGKIWGMNFANEVFFLQKDTLRKFHFPNDFVPNGNLIKFVLSENHLWLLTAKQLTALHLQSHQIDFSFETDEANSDFFDVAIFQQQIYLSAPQKVFLIDRNKKIKTWNTHLNFVSRFLQTREQLWVAQRENIGRKAAIFQDNQWKKLPDFDISENVTVFHYKTTKDFKTWICTKQGGFLWDTQTGKTTLLFPNKQFTGIVEDYQGNYWISTLDEGLWFCPSLTSLVFSPIPEKKLGKSYISSIYASDKPQHFWLGTANGLICETTLTDSSKHQYFESNFKKEITAFLIDKQKQEIISSSGIFPLASKVPRAISTPKDVAFYKNEFVLSAQSFTAEWAAIYQNLKDTLSNLFGATLNGKKSLSFRYPIYTLRNQRAYCVCVDSLQQKFWVGFADNLYEYRFSGGHKIIRSQDGESIVARSMCTDSKGNLYVATFNQGVFVIKDGVVQKNFRKNHLLKSDVGKQVLNYKDTIWIGTDEEIGFLYSDNTQFYDVVGNNSIGKISYQRFLPTQNNLLIATGSQILSLDREKIVVLGEIRLLPPKISIQDNHVSIWLEALNYKNPEYNRFYYRLSDEKSWNSTDDINALLQYNQLNPKKYTLEFYAEDILSGVKSPIQQITFQIPKKWWQELWLLALSVLLAFGVGFLIFKWWLKRYQNKQKLKENLWVSQLKAIKTQMNPHFLYNVLNTVQGLVYGNRKSEASDLLGNFSDLMRKMLESSEKPYISLKEELENLRLYLELEKIRFEDSSFHYQISSDVHNLQEYQIPSMLLQPFAENAVKHGLLHKKGDKNLWIQVEKYREGIKIIIDDNGVGREQAQEIRQRQHKKSTQFAGSAIAQRIDLINKMNQFKIDLQIIDKKNSTGEALGTKVEIVVEPTL